MSKVLATLTDAQYYKLQHQAERANAQKLKAEYANAQYVIATRDAEIARLKAELFRYVTVVHQESVRDHEQKQFATVRDEISKELGFELEGKSIHQFTHDVLDD